MTYPTDDPPVSFTLPSLPEVFDEWFRLAGEGELIYDGSILDDLGVRDEASARLALVGYRFVWVDGAWVDEAEAGRWDAAWVVLDSIGADPILADVSSPEVPVLIDQHGRGRWAPVRRHPSLREFIAAIDVAGDVPGPPPFEEPSLGWEVWITDLGATPLQGLVRLKAWPLFPVLTQRELLDVRNQLPYRLVSGLPEPAAHSCVDFGSGLGIGMQAVEVSAP